jgi:hypothetical protein
MRSMAAVAEVRTVVAVVVGPTPVAAVDRTHLAVRAADILLVDMRLARQVARRRRLGRLVVGIGGIRFMAAVRMEVRTPREPARLVRRTLLRREDSRRIIILGKRHQLARMARLENIRRRERVRDRTRRLLVRRMFRFRGAGEGMVSADIIRAIRTTAAMDLGWDLADFMARMGRVILSGAASDMALDIMAAEPDMDITAEVFPAAMLVRI